MKISSLLLALSVSQSALAGPVKNKRKNALSEEQIIDALINHPGLMPPQGSFLIIPNLGSCLEV